MRITYVTQWYPPEPAGPAYAPAAALAARGHEINVVTGFPNYPTGVLHDGYRLRPYQREDRGDGIAVHRVPLIPTHDANPIKRMSNYLSFAASASVLSQFLPPADVWLTYSSPATAAIPRLVQRPGHRAPHFMIIQDLWPDSVTASGFVPGVPGRLMHGALDLFCRATYRDASGIGVISPGMRDVLVARGVPDAKIVDTPNWVEPREPSGADLNRTTLGLPENGFLFLYAGNLGELQALDDLVDAFAGLGSQAHLVLMGDGIKREVLARRVSEEGLRNVHVLPPVAPDAVADYYAACDAAVISLADIPLLRVTMPSKVQASLAAGRPILAHCAGDAARVVVEAGAGLDAPPGDVEATRAAIRRLVESSVPERRQMGERARQRFTDVYSPSAGGERLERALGALTS